MCSKELNVERIRRWQRNLECVNIAWGKITLVTHVLGAEGVELTVQGQTPLVTSRGENSSRVHGGEG